ncbi:MAG: hypothetical protein KatS3mg015_2688 [Fimbriimonadales bacterium]|nr:MAG: hypothetical protein KatS3mg015_2688 [Fimbriimonadales bacterium]
MPSPSIGLPVVLWSPHRLRMVVRSMEAMILSREREFFNFLTNTLSFIVILADDTYVPAVFPSIGSLVLA